VTTAGAGYRSGHPLRLLPLALFILAACAQSQPTAPQATGTPAGPVTITFANWAAAETATKDHIAQTIAGFEQANPNIKVTSVPIAFTDIGHQLQLQNASGNAPDVAEVAGNDGPALVQAKALEPLENRLSKSFVDSLLPTVKALGEFQGHLDIAPWTVAPLGFWYNRDILAKAGLDPAAPPKTLDQLTTAMARIKSAEPDVIPLGLDTTNRTFGLDVNWALMRDFNANPFSGGKATADTAAMGQYLTFIRTLGQKGYTVPNQKIGYFRPLAAQAKVAFQFDGPYLQGVIQSVNHQSNADFYNTWGVTTLPAGSSGKHFSTPTDHQLVMFKSSRQKAAAAKFIEWLAGSKPAISDYTVKYESSLPPLKNAISAFPAELNTPVFKAFASQVVPVVTRPAWGNTYTNGYSVVMAGVQKSIAGSEPISQIQSEMQSELRTQLGS
jgi:multiple sugar transport system substrate-binding protein